MSAEDEACPRGCCGVPCGCHRNTPLCCASHQLFVKPIAVSSPDCEPHPHRSSSPPPKPSAMRTEQLKAFLLPQSWVSPRAQPTPPPSQDRATTHPALCIAGLLTLGTAQAAFYVIFSFRLSPASQHRNRDLALGAKAELVSPQPRHPRCSPAVPPPRRRGCTHPAPRPASREQTAPGFTRSPLTGK